jgi:hypothetical protein
MHSVVPLMEKRLTQAGIWIQFDSVISEPVLCTALCLMGDKDTHVLSHCYPKIQLRQKTRRLDCLYFC